MRKYSLAVIFLIIALASWLGAKPSWVIHSDKSLAGVAARVADIENNLDTNKTTLDSITTAVITTATITTANITTGTVTTFRATTADITAGDTIKATVLQGGTHSRILGADSITTTILRSGSNSDIIGADSVTATVIRGTTGSDLIGADSVTATVIRGGTGSDLISADSITATLEQSTRIRGGLLEATDTLNPICLGDSGTNGSFRFKIIGDSLFLQHREAGAWNRCAAFTPTP